MTAKRLEALTESLTNRAQSRLHLLASQPGGLLRGTDGYPADRELTEGGMARLELDSALNPLLVITTQGRAAAEAMGW